jgi:hypothetical protein
MGQFVYDVKGVHHLDHGGEETVIVMLLRSLSAASQSFCSKPRLAPLPLLADLADFFLAAFFFPMFTVSLAIRRRLDPISATFPVKTS